MVGGSGRGVCAASTQPPAGRSEPHADRIISLPRTQEWIGGGISELGLSLCYVLGRSALV